MGVQFLIVEPEDQLLVLIPEGVASDQAHLFSRSDPKDLVVMVRVNEVLVILLKGRKDRGEG